MDREELRWRIKAARMLGGFGSADALADALKTPGLSATTLRAIEGEGYEKRVAPWKLDAIARACGLPPDFFTADRSSLPELVARGDPVLERLSRIEAQLALLLGDGEAPEEVARWMGQRIGELAQAHRQASASTLGTSSATLSPPGAAEDGGR